jgi:DEAD/DEAH box helicase domain-containing protein
MASTRFDPTIFFFDRCPGGIGLAERMYETAEALIELTLALVERCKCDHGCPACVGPSTADARRKPTAIALLRRLHAGCVRPTRSTPIALGGSSVRTA